jgi:polysaccharide biosynthesis protein PslG
MPTSHPRPRRALAQQAVTLLVATCLTLLAIVACAGARTTTQPTAVIGSTALHSAIVARTAARHALAHDAGKLRACLRLGASRCSPQQRTVKRARVRLASARGRVRSISARIARRHHTSEGTHSLASTSGYGSGSGSTEGSATGTSGGSGSGNSGGSTEGTGGGASSGAGSPTETFGEPFVKGVVTNLQGWGISAVSQISSEMTSLGVNWVREDLSWSDIESKKGVFNWSSFDQMVSAAKAKGITVLPIVGYAPAWTSPSDATDYAAFVKAAVQRYGPGTSANLKWWELWNEPYFAYAWSGKTPEPEAYARDALAAAKAAKEVSPLAKLLISADYQDSSQTGGSTPWQTSWISDMFSAAPSLGSFIDGISVHPYGDDPALKLAKLGGWEDSNHEWAFQRIDTIRAKFLEQGVNLPFWITEEGWSTTGVSEATQAQNYTDLIPQIAARPWIRALFPYCLREFSASATDHESQFGLLKFGTWQPKPAFYALQKGLTTLS